MRHGRRSVGGCLLALLATACSPDYEGPLADKPIRVVEGSRQGQSMRSETIYTLNDLVLDQEVPEIAWRQATQFFDQYRGIIKNRSWLTIADFTQHSGYRRLYVIDLNSGQVDRLHVAHGKGSDPNDTGYARIFGNEVNSYMTSLGFYLVSESYTGKWGYSARMDGLQDSNSRARERAIVLHGATYVSPNLPQMGRTQGCPAIEMAWVDTLVNRLKGKSLFYAYLEGM